MEFKGRLCDICAAQKATYKCCVCGKDLCIGHSGIIHLGLGNDSYSNIGTICRSSIEGLNSEALKQIDHLNQHIICSNCATVFKMDVSKMEFAQRVEVASKILELMKPYFVSQKI